MYKRRMYDCTCTCVVFDVKIDIPSFIINISRQDFFNVLYACREKKRGGRKRKEGQMDVERKELNSFRLPVCVYLNPLYLIAMIE